MTLTGKTALVTGGSRGIGRAVVQRLSEAGARVVYTYQRNAAADDGDDVVAVRADQSSLDTVGAAFDPVRESGLDIVVLNAGIADQKRIADLTPADIGRVMTVNATWPLLALRETMGLIRDGGRIVVVSTLNTVLAGPGIALYAGSKAALEQFAAVAAYELGDRGITVNTVSPGATDTDMLRAENAQEALDRAAAMSPLQRLGTPGDVAAVIAWLVGPDAGWVTGQNIRATGGLVV